MLLRFNEPDFKYGATQLGVNAVAVAQFMDMLGCHTANDQEEAPVLKNSSTGTADGDWSFDVERRQRGRGPVLPHRSVADDDSISKPGKIFKGTASSSTAGNETGSANKNERGIRHKPKMSPPAKFAAEPLEPPLHALQSRSLDHIDKELLPLAPPTFKHPPLLASDTAAALLIQRLFRRMRTRKWKSKAKNFAQLAKTKALGERAVRSARRPGVLRLDDSLFI